MKEQAGTNYEDNKEEEIEESIIEEDIPNAYGNQDEGKFGW